MAWATRAGSSPLMSPGIAQDPFEALAGGALPLVQTRPLESLSSLPTEDERELPVVRAKVPRHREIDGDEAERAAAADDRDQPDGLEAAAQRAIAG